jgi:hypothetical protein
VITVNQKLVDTLVSVDAVSVSLVDAAAKALILAAPSAPTAAPAYVPAGHGSRREQIAGNRRLTVVETCERTRAFKQHHQWMNGMSMAGFAGGTNLGSGYPPWKNRT